MNEVTTSEITELLSDRDYWLNFEYSRWRLLSFTGRDAARFGWLDSQKKQYLKYVKLNAGTLGFMRGVQPDAWNYWS